MVFLCIACIVLSSIALHGIAWHCIAFDYLLWYCMVLRRLQGVVQLIWRAGELPRSASSHFLFMWRVQTDLLNHYEVKTSLLSERMRCNNV